MKSNAREPGFRSDRRDMMQAFDDLPDVVRQALCEAAFPWAAAIARAALESGHSADEVARLIHLNDCAKILRTAREVWGPDYLVQP